MNRNETISRVKVASGTGKNDGTRKSIHFQEGDKVYFVENHSTVRVASVIRRMGDFYTISIGNGGITLRGSRIFATEEEAQNSISGCNRKLDFDNRISEVSNQRRYRTPYSYVNERSPYGI